MQEVNEVKVNPMMPKQNMILNRINSLTPERCGSNFESVISEHIMLRIWVLAEIIRRWMPQNTFDDKSKLVQVMAWCCQATSHYLSQCWLTSMSPNKFTRPQLFNAK